MASCHEAVGVDDGSETVKVFLCNGATALGRFIFPDD